MRVNQEFGRSTVVQPSLLQADSGLPRGVRGEMTGWQVGKTIVAVGEDLLDDGVATALTAPQYRSYCGQAATISPPLFPPSGPRSTT